MSENGSLERVAVVPAAGAARSLDETADARVFRPLGKWVASYFVRTTVTANQVSAMSALCGAAAGVGFALPWPLPGYGAVLLFTMMVLDCADGEVARQRGGGGWRGRILDGLADLVTAFAVHLGMLLYVNRHPATVLGFELGPFTNFLLALLAGASMQWRCGVIDDIKQRLKSHSVDRELAAHAGEVKGLWDRFLFLLLSTYVKKIERYAGQRRPGGYALFRRVQVVGPTHHHLAMVLSGLAVYLSPLAYYGFFFISLVPANLFLLWMVRVAPPEES